MTEFKPEAIDPKSYWDNFKSAAQEAKDKGVSWLNDTATPYVEGAKELATDATKSITPYAGAITTPIVGPVGGALVNHEVSEANRPPYVGPGAKQNSFAPNTNPGQNQSLAQNSQKAQSIPNTSSVDSISPKHEQMNQYDKADDADEQSYQRQMQSLQEQQQTLRVGIDTAHTMDQGAAARQAADEQENARLEAASHKEAADKGLQIDKEMQDVMSTKIDPQHWYKEKGTAGSILAAISIAAGAFAAAMPHTGNHENQALGIINGSIDRDINAQQSDLDKRFKLLDFKGTKLQRDIVQNNWMQEQRTSEAYKRYGMAIAQAQQVRQNASTTAQAQGVDGLIEGLQQKRNDILKDKADHRYSWKMSDAAAAKAAQQAADPYSKDNLAKRKTISEINHTNASTDKLKGGGDQFTSGLKSFDDAAAGAMNAGVISSVTGSGALGQRINPSGASAQQKLDSYNHMTLPGFIRLVGDRVPPEAIEKAIASSTIHATDTPEMRQQKTESARNFVKGAMQLKGKGNSNDDDNKIDQTEVK